MKEREYPYVDEHEYNCAHILKVEEKPRMTCYEKLKSEHPDWDEKTLYEYTQRICPSYLDWLEDPADCRNGMSNRQCADCWNRKMEE